MTPETMQFTQPIVQLERVYYSYEGETKSAIREISLEIHPGDSVAILGGSESGKTTLLLAMSNRLEALRKGRLTGLIRHAGTFAALPRERQVGAVLQDPEAMFCNLRVWEEVAFGLEGLLRDEAEIASRVRETLALVGLTHLDQRFIYELSGGELQRLAIACALAPSPQLLLLDEVTESLDPATREGLLEVLTELRHHGTAIVFSTKGWSSWVEAASRVIVLVGGDCKASGSPMEVLRACGEVLEQWGVLCAEKDEIAMMLGEQRALSLPTNECDVLNHLLLGMPVESGAPTRRQFSSESDSKEVVRIKNLYFAYGDKPVFEDLCLSIPSGQLVAFVGRNGSGKTTLAKLVAGLLVPSKGSLVKSTAPGPLPSQSRVGYVFQNPAHQFLFETAFQEIAFAFQLLVRDQASAHKQIVATLRDIELPERTWTQSPLHLRPTQQRLLAIVTMAILEPDVLILDEPTHGQDAHTRKAISKLVSTIKNLGHTVILITHDMRFVEELADRVYVFAERGVVFEGPPSEVFSQPDLLKQAGLETTLLSRLVSIARDRGKDITRLRTARDLISDVRPRFAT